MGSFASPIRLFDAGFPPLAPGYFGTPEDLASVHRLTLWPVLLYHERRTCTFPVTFPTARPCAHKDLST